MVDRFGNEFHLGDLVTYPVRRGSSMWVVDGHVERIDDEGGYLTIAVSEDRGDKLRRRVPNVQNVTIIERDGR